MKNKLLCNIQAKKIIFVLITFQTQIKHCEAIFHIPFETTIGPSSYRYKVDVFQELIPFIFHPIASGRGQLIVTGKISFVSISGIN